MKEFARRHIHAVLTASGVLLLTVISLSVFLGLAFRADAVEDESRRVLDRARYAGTVDRLKDSLDSGSGMESYHFALKASDDASAIGENDAASMFRRMADSLLENGGSTADAKDTLETYLAGGEAVVPEIPADDGTDVEEAIEAVSLFRQEAAEACVKKLFGEHSVLRRELKSRNGELVYSCSNAYAVIDSRTGLPTEAALSLPPAEIRLSPADCVDCAMRFLEEFFPADTAAGAVVTDVKNDNFSGSCEVTVMSKNRRITMSVRRDSGRVARLTAR